MTQEGVQESQRGAHRASPPPGAGILGGLPPSCLSRHACHLGHPVLAPEEDGGVRLFQALALSERIRAITPFGGPGGKAKGQALKLGVCVGEDVRMHSSGADARAQPASPSYTPCLSSALLPELLSRPFGQRGWVGGPWVQAPLSAQDSVALSRYQGSLKEGLPEGRPINPGAHQTTVCSRLAGSPPKGRGDSN